MPYIRWMAVVFQQLFTWRCIAWAITAKTEHLQFVYQPTKDRVNRGHMIEGKFHLRKGYHWYPWRIGGLYPGWKALMPLLNYAVCGRCCVFAVMGSMPVLYRPHHLAPQVGYGTLPVWHTVQKRRMISWTWNLHSQSAMSHRECLKHFAADQIFDRIESANKGTIDWQEFCPIFQSWKTSCIFYVKWNLMCQRLLHGLLPHSLVARITRYRMWEEIEVERPYQRGMALIAW